MDTHEEYLNRLEPEYNDVGELIGWYDPVGDEFLPAEPGVV
jgi:hypothetical protein